MKRTRTPSPDAANQRRRLEVEPPDENYRLPSGWVRREDPWPHPSDYMYYQNIIGNEPYYENLVTGDIARTRPTRGVYTGNRWEDFRTKWYENLGPILEESRTLPERQKPQNPHGQRPNAPFPRKIPRPQLTPTLGSQKWKPSFDYLYEYTNQSGFTPPESLSPKCPLSPVYHAHAIPRIMIVKKHLANYTLKELHDVGAIDAYGTGMGENTLTNEIIPLLNDYWLTPGPPILGKPGRTWDLDDEEVGEIMKPILRLCSRFITSANTSDWWDANLKADRVPIDPKVTKNS